MNGLKIFKADLIIKDRPPMQIYFIDLENRQFIVYHNQTRESIPFELADNLIISISGIPVMLGLN